MKNCSPIRGGQQKWSRNSEDYRIRSPLRRPQSKDEDLALFHDMRMLENKNFLHPSTDDMEASLRVRICVSPTPAWKGNDLRAMAETEKTDYDWLLTPPGTPLFPSLDKDSWQNYMGRCMISQSYSASKGSRCVGSGTPEPQRPGRRSPGPWTPTSTASSISSSHSASRARAPSPSRIGSSPSLRPSTPSKTLGRSNTVMNRASTRSSPPILRRANTSPSPRSSSVERSATSSKPRNSASQKLPSWHASELGFSAEPPPNLRTSLSDRPTSGLRSGSGRPRIGAQEARHHQQPRHSYSDALETRRSYLRTSSSSTSRLSSSTASQDRWSSRGSMFSSSDDGLDALEPPFMDSCATSISSTSGTDNNVSGRLDNEATSRCSPVTRQRKTPVSTMETARFSASARKSLDSCMQRADHNRLPQTMFRPLMCNAPTTSYFSIGRSVATRKPANFLVDPSITASSNASSERGARIFPGNESSEEEVESGWDRSVRTASSTSKPKLNEGDVGDASLHPTHDLIVQYEQESVANDASTTTMDRSEKESVVPLCSYNQAMNCCDDQESSADPPFTSNSNDVQNISACLHSDPINLHPSDRGQKDTEVSDVCRKDSIPFTAKDTDCCEHANRELTTASAISPLERHKNAPDNHCAEKIRMDPTALKSTSDSYIQEGSLDSENKISSLNVWPVDELPLAVHSSPLDVSQETFMQGMEKSPHKCAILLEEASSIESISASSDSVIAGICERGHVQSDQIHSGAPTIEDKKSLLCLEPQGDMSCLSSEPKSEQSSSPAGKMNYSLEASSGRDYTTTPQEIEESNILSKFDCLATLEKHCFTVNDRDSDSKSLLSPDETEVCAFECDHEIDVESEGLKGHNNTLLQNAFVKGSSQEDTENFPSHNALFPEILGPGLQDNEHCSDVSNSVVESSINCSLVAELPKEEFSSNAASLQSIPQFSGDLQPDCSLDPSLPQEATQARTLSTLQGSGVESAANEVTPISETDSLQQPGRGDHVHIVATPSFSLEEATNTILFCSSIIHDIVYKAASIAAEKEAEATKVESSSFPQNRGLNANSAFISSLREKMSKSATWKPRHKEAKACAVKSQKEEVALPMATVTDCPTPFLTMVREPARVDDEKPVTDNAKDKSFMGISVDNCQCSIM